MSNLRDLQVVLLCGGRGERLRPLTDSIPKPLVPIRGRPILSYLISYFKNQGVRHFVIAVGYQSDKVRDYLREEHRDIEAHLVDSGDVDILKRLQDMSHLLRNDFLLCYGDTLADVNLAKLSSFHKHHGRLASITSYPLQTQFGILELDSQGQVESFKEKPVLDKWINIGYYYMRREIVDRFGRHESFVGFLNGLVKDSELYSYQHKGIHITVNTLKELSEAEENIGSFEDTWPRI